VISLIFGFLSFITGALLNATNRQKTQTSLLAACLVVNIIINLFLIPRWGIIGAATSALASNTLLCFGGFYFSSREITMRYRALFKYANQSFWPALVMAFVVYFLKQKMHFILTVPIGVIVYGCLLFVTGGITRNMVKQVIAKVFKFQPEEPV
jgi:O-antigen/teichoic acid export membrane protein